MSGWVKLHRSLADHPRFGDPDWLSVWVYLLIHAAHKPRRTMFNGTEITLKPGQLITGRRSISEATGVNESKCKRILMILESDQQIDRVRGSKSSLISITNWQSYQDSDQQDDQLVTSKWPASDQQNDQLVTSTTTTPATTYDHPESKSDQQVFPKVTTVQEYKNNSTEDTNVSSCPVTSRGEAHGPKESREPEEEPVMTFPCHGKIPEWHLLPSKVQELSEVFPGLDVTFEARKALQWVRENRPKTAKGMGRFLFGWMERANNRGGGTRAPRQTIYSDSDKY